MPPHQLLDIFVGGFVVFFNVLRVDLRHAPLPAQFEGAERILAAAANDCEVIDAAPAAELMQRAIDEIVPTGKISSIARCMSSAAGAASMTSQSFAAAARMRSAPSNCAGRGACRKSTRNTLKNTTKPPTNISRS